MLTDDQLIAKKVGIDQALQVVPEELTNLALRFFHAYAQRTPRFTSSEVMVEFMARYGGVDPGNGKGWRDSWGSITKKAIQEGIMAHCGFAKTPQKHRHEQFGKLFESRVLSPDVQKPEDSPDLDQLKFLVLEWRKGSSRDPMELATSVYEFAYHSASAQLLKE